MSKAKILLASLFLGSALVATTAAQGNAVKDIPATSTIFNSGVSASGTPYAFSIQSDGGGDYTNSQTVRSVVQTGGDWILDTSPFKATPVRSVLIDFRDSAPGGPPNPPFSVTTVHARFIVKCHLYNVNMLDMAVGISDECPLAVSFQYGVNSYRIAMNNVNFVDTDPVTITCKGVGTNQCNEWTIAPYSRAVILGKSIGKLIKVATKPRETDQDMGNFYFSFSLKVSIP